MTIKIICTSLTKWDRLCKRWGLAFLINDSIIFDTFGNADIFEKNMARIHVDLFMLSHVVISHDHWDHTGGLIRLLEKIPSLKTVICPGFTPETKSLIQRKTTKMIEAAQSIQLVEGIWTTGELLTTYKNEPLAEQGLVAETSAGLILITGCAHPGILTMIRHTKKLFQKPVYAVLGGFHLLHKTTEEIRLLGQKIKEEGVQKIGATHCTGPSAVKTLKQLFKYDFINIMNYKIIEF